MLKKMIVAGGALALLSSLSVGVPLWSYARCGISGVTTAASDAMPLEWELKRARQLIVDLEPEIQQNARRIAEEKIAVNHLTNELESTTDSLAKAKSNIARLNDDLSEGTHVYAYGGRTYTSAQVKADLTKRAKRYKTREQTSEKLNQMLTARQASLDAAHQQMDAMLGQKRQLEVEVENLQARLAALRVAQTNSSFSIDNSALSRTRELIDSIEARIDGEETTLSVQTEYVGEINLDEPSEADLDDLVSSILNGETEQLVAIQLD